MVIEFLDMPFENADEIGLQQKTLVTESLTQTRQCRLTALKAASNLEPTCK